MPAFNYHFLDCFIYSCGQASVSTTYGNPGYEVSGQTNKMSTQLYNYGFNFK